MTYHFDDKLDILSKEFYERFKSLFGCLDYKFEYRDKLKIMIPTGNKNVGEMTIWCEKDEIVVCLGKHFHTHFEGYSSGEDIKNSKTRDEVITEALEFLQNVFDDKVLLRVEKIDGKSVSSSISYINEKDKGFIKVYPVNGLLKKVLYNNREVSLNTWSRTY